MNNFLLLLGALLVGILAALVAVPMAIDWNSYRGVFEEEASRLMGRDVRVGGGVNVRILPVPYVRFEKLRIADTSSTGGDPLFRADSVTMQLSIAPLLRGVLEAKSVELKRPLLRLAIDTEGRGNWRSLALKPGSLPFVPADVALQSVGIEDGKLVIAGSGAKDLAEISAIAGELSADSFDGPYKFKGTANWGGEPRDVKLSTAKPDAGGVRLRASIRVPSSETSYSFDGRVVDLQGRPRVDGDVTAKLGMATEGARKTSAGSGDLGFDFKAKFSGDLKSGVLDQIELSRDDPVDAQLVTGQAKVSWDSAIKVDAVLSSRSFNLDRLAATGTAAGDPLETARTALAIALAGLPAEAETSAAFKADRVMLHGEALSGLTAEVSRHGGEIEVRMLKVQLPGATRLLASGILTKDQHQASFTGPVSLRGANLARFIAWSQTPAAPNALKPQAASGTAAPAHYEGPFAVEGDLAMNGARLELTRATAELSGHSISGELRVAMQGRRSVGLVLDGERIDAAGIWPGGFNPAELRAYLTGSASAASPSARPPATGLYGFDPETMDLSVQVRAGELLVTPALNLKAVDSAFSVTGGKLTVPRLRFQTEEGLSVDIDGELAGLAVNSASGAPAAGVPHGTVRFNLDAATREAAVALLSAVDWPQAGRPGDAAIQSMAALAPLHLAGSTVIGAHAPRALDLTIDGTVDGGHVTARSHLDAGLHAWAVAPLDLSASIETADPARILAIAGLASPPVATPTLSRPSRIAVQASGTPRSGLATYAELVGDRLSITSHGMATVSPGFDVAYDGTSTVDARDVTEALALCGLSLGQGPSETPFSGTVRVATGPTGMTLAAAGAKLGASGLTGSMAVKPAVVPVPGRAAAPRSVTARLALSQASLPAMFAAISDRRQQSGPGARWPEQTLKIASPISGRVDLTIDQLVIDGPLGAKNAIVTLLLEPESVKLQNLQASALGGSVKAGLDLKSEAGGTTLSGTFALTDASLAAITGQAQGPLSLTASVKGQGLSASALIAGMSGSGEADLGGGQIKGVAPSAVAGLVDGVLAAKEPVTGDALSDALRRALTASSLVLTPQKVPFQIAFGVVKLPAYAFKAPAGRSTLEASLDLAALTYALDWRIEAASKPTSTGAVKPPLSAVRLTSEGALSALPGAEMKMSLGSFEQEIVVRKMEHDAEELERLRKLDEEMRKQEDADRQKKEAEDAAALSAASKAAADGQPPAPSPAAAPEAAPPQAGQPATASGGATPPDAAPAPAPPAPSPAVRRRQSGPPPQASGIPQPFGNNY